MGERGLGALLRHECKQGSVDLQFAQGRMRIACVDEGMVRVRATGESEFAARRSWDVVAPEMERASLPVTVAEDGDRLTLAAGRLRVRVAREDGRVAFTDERGKELASDSAPLTWVDMAHEDSRRVMDPHYPSLALAIPTGLDGELGKRARTAARVTKAMAPDEVYYGFGERVGLLDRRGRAMTSWNIDPPTGLNRGQDNLYQSHPFFLALRPGLAWGLFLHSTWYSQFNVGATRWDALEVMTLGGELDYYLLYGSTPAEVIERLTRLTGCPAVPPLWALGYHQSRWSYMTQEEALSVARGFRERGVPLDAMHLDIDYMRGYRDFTWDPERFPRPAELTAALREQGARTVTIIDPGVKEDLGDGYVPADDGVAHDMFIRNPDGTLFSGYCWPDAALFPDFTRSEVREWWGEQHRGHVEKGVAGIWDDMNEPAIFDRPFSSGFSAQKPMPPDTPQGPQGERTVHAEVHNLYGLLMCRATYEGLLRLRPEERPWVLTRSGYSGMQAYAASWMGDNSSWWEHLEGSLPQLMSMGVSGVPHVGVDVGGFHGNPGPELYARWIQTGAFYPFMRTHTAMGTQQQEPWSFGPEVEEIARQAILLRYRLLPYLYTLAHEAHRTGAPILRPLAYDFPHDPSTYHVDDQAMFGPHLLLAPILRPGRRGRAVYLPEGRWYDYWSGQRIEGARTVIADAPLERIPLFVRGGAVLLLGNERLTTATPLTALTLDVYPAGDSAFTLIEDDGVTMAYEEGEFAETAVRVSEDEDRLTVEVDARRGRFQPHPRTIIAQLHTGRTPTNITLDGQAYEDGSWEAERGTVGVRWEDDGGAHQIVCSYGM